MAKITSQGEVPLLRVAKPRKLSRPEDGPRILGYTGPRVSLDAMEDAMKLGYNATEKANRGETDWEWLRALPDSDIKLTDDAPGTCPDDWSNAIAHRGLPVHGKLELARPGSQAGAWEPAK